MEHYATMGCIHNGFPQNSRYIRELVEPLYELDQTAFVHNGSGRMLEVGCGLGMYVPYFLRLGWNYTAVETGKIACHWTRNCFDVHVIEEKFENIETSPFNLIFGAHVFEHMTDAPAMFEKAYNMIAYYGKLVIVIPDDTDQLNPSHRWFFSRRALHGHLEDAGFENVRSTVRKIVAHENFIYCVADKGGV
jgi:cyclopropane fatty-acyl-phospholipid synthase-like methyltransferase